MVGAVEVTVREAEAEMKPPSVAGYNDRICSLVLRLNIQQRQNGIRGGEIGSVKRPEVQLNPVVPAGGDRREIDRGTRSGGLVIQTRDIGWSNRARDKTHLVKKNLSSVARDAPRI